MFDLQKIFNKFESKNDKDAIARLLKTTPEALEAFEKAYGKASIMEENDNFFSMNAKEASVSARTTDLPKEIDETFLREIIDRIVDELLASTDGKLLSDHLGDKLPVSNEDIKRLPKKLRPDLTGTLMKVDVSQPSYPMLLIHYKNYLETSNPKAKAQYYGMFRQGLDILDYDPVMYEIVGMNLNSIGHWFYQIKDAAEKHGFFKIPETKIVKVPMPILQLTRQDYMSLTPTTLKIVDDWAMKAFGLDVTKTYFVKTGTYSSKYDFRNCKVTGEKEVRELGEYLLFIHHQANMMASPLNVDPETGKSLSIYGVSTTNEWCVRKYIEDKENAPTIYHGLPLHTEYRVFVDFDKDDILGIAPYWKPDVMKKRFSEGHDADSADMKHDYIIYSMYEETLMKRYEQNKDLVLARIWDLLPDVNLHGQWSIDVMQNGDDFWIIDMALAQNSALLDCVPKEKLLKTEENWLPILGMPEETKEN